MGREGEKQAQLTAGSIQGCNYENNAHIQGEFDGVSVPDAGDQSSKEKRALRMCVRFRRL